MTYPPFLRWVEGRHSSPGFPGEGDQAKPGGGVLAASEEPLHRASRGPPPREISGRNYGVAISTRPPAAQSGGGAGHDHEGAEAVGAAFVAEADDGGHQVGAAPGDADPVADLR